jgi:hypothetical protein
MCVVALLVIIPAAFWLTLYIMVPDQKESRWGLAPLLIVSPILGIGTLCATIWLGISAVRTRSLLSISVLGLSVAALGVYWFMFRQLLILFSDMSGR